MAQCSPRLFASRHRSNPHPGDPPLGPESAVGICTCNSHCAQPGLDAPDARPEGAAEEFYQCDVCRQFGPMTLYGARGAAARTPTPAPHTPHPARLRATQSTAPPRLRNPSRRLTPPRPRKPSLPPPKTAAWRHSLDAEMYDAANLQSNLDRILRDALHPDVPKYGPEPARPRAHPSARLPPPAFARMVSWAARRPF